MTFLIHLYFYSFILKIISTVFNIPTGAYTSIHTSGGMLGLGYIIYCASMSCHATSLRFGGWGGGQLLRYHTCIRYVTLHKLKEHHEKRRSDKGGGFVSFRLIHLKSILIRFRLFGNGLKQVELN